VQTVQRSVHRSNRSVQTVQRSTGVVVHFRVCISSTLCWRSVNLTISSTLSCRPTLPCHPHYM
jgi:hypothetical protein